MANGCRVTGWQEERPPLPCHPVPSHLGSPSPRAKRIITRHRERSEQSPITHHLIDARVTGERVSLGGHDEVVAMQTADLVTPPGDGHLSPLGDESRVMPLVLGELAD